MERGMVLDFFLRHQITHHINLTDFYASDLTSMTPQYVYRSACLEVKGFVKHSFAVIFLLIEFVIYFSVCSQRIQKQEQSLSMVNLVTINSQTVMKTCVTSWIKCLIHILKVINSNPVNSLSLLNVSQLIFSSVIAHQVS